MSLLMAGASRGWQGRLARPVVDQEAAGLGRTGLELRVAHVASIEAGGRQADGVGTRGLHVGDDRLGAETDAGREVEADHGPRALHVQAADVAEQGALDGERAAGVGAVERAGRVCGATPALDGGTTSGIISSAPTKAGTR